MPAKRDPAKSTPAAKVASVKPKQASAVARAVKGKAKAKVPSMMHATCLAGIRLVDGPWFPYLCTEAEGWRWQSHIQGHFNLWLVLGGQGLLWCDGQAHTLKPGSVFVFAPGQSVRATHTPGFPINRLAMHFVPDGWEEGQTVAGLPLMGAMLPDTAKVRPMIDQVCGLAPVVLPVASKRADESASSPGSDADTEQALKSAVAFELLLTVLNDATTQAEAGIPEPVIACLDAMHAQPEKTWSAQALADLAGVSRPHLDRLFVAHVGQPPRRYAIGLKLAKAQQWLANTDQPIAHIAERLGYRDVYFFSRQFKQTMGQTPSAFRSKAKGQV